MIRTLLIIGPWLLNLRRVRNLLQDPLVSYCKTRATLIIRHTRYLL